MGPGPIEVPVAITPTSEAGEASLQGSGRMGEKAEERKGWTEGSCNHGILLPAGGEIVWRPMGAARVNRIGREGAARGGNNLNSPTLDSILGRERQEHGAEDQPWVTSGVEEGGRGEVKGGGRLQEDRNNLTRGGYG